MIVSSLFSLDSLNVGRFWRRRSEIVNISDKHCCITHTKKRGDTYKTALKINSEWWHLPPNNCRLIEHGMSHFGWILARSGWNLVQFQERKCNLGADLSVWIHISTNHWALQDQKGLRSGGTVCAWFGSGPARYCVPVFPSDFREDGVPQHLLSSGPGAPFPALIISYKCW